MTGPNEKLNDNGVLEDLVFNPIVDEDGDELEPVSMEDYIAEGADEEPAS